MTIVISTGLAAIALALLAHHDAIEEGWQRVYALASLCAAVASVVSGFVVEFAA